VIEALEAKLDENPESLWELEEQTEQRLTTEFNVTTLVLCD